MHPNPGNARIIVFAIATTLVCGAASPSMAQRGDMNCDGAVNTADIPLFVQALLGTGSFGGCDINRADMNADARVNGLDTQAFAAALLASGCPPGTDFNWDALNCGSCGHACQGTEYCSWGECYGVCIGCGP